MSDILRRAAGKAASIRDLYRKLSRAQAVALVILFVLAGIAFAGAAFPRGGSEWRRIPSAGDAAPGTGEAVSIAHTKEPSADTAGRPHTSSWLWDTPRKIEEAAREQNQRKVEQAIALNPRVQAASIVISRAPSARHALAEAGEDSASVTVQLRKGIADLDGEAADSIRGMVANAFNIRPEKVSITDNFLRSYDSVSAGKGSARVLAAQEKYRTDIKQAIVEHYLKLLDAREFQVTVMVNISAEQSSIEKVEVDPEKSFTMAASTRYKRVDGIEPPLSEETGGLISPRGKNRPSSLRKVSESIDEKPFVTRSKVLTDIPPGAVRGVSVIALLDLGAVERVLAEEEASRRRPPGSSPGAGEPPAHSVLPVLPVLPEERAALLADFTRKEEEALESLLSPLAESRVMILVHPFVNPSREKEPASPPSLASAPDSPASVPAGEDWTGFAIISTATLAVLWASIAAARRRGRSPLTGPRETGARGPDGSRSRRAGYPAGERLAAGMADDVLRNVSGTSAAVRERPEVAASVLRFWLSQDFAEAAEAGARS